MFFPKIIIIYPSPPSLKKPQTNQMTQLVYMELIGWHFTNMKYDMCCTLKNDLLFKSYNFIANTLLVKLKAFVLNSFQLQIYMPVVTKNRALPHQTRFKEQDKYILFNHFIDRQIWEINKSDYGLSTSISNQCLTIHLDRRLESPWQTGYWRFSTELSTKVSKLLV